MRKSGGNMTLWSVRRTLGVVVIAVLAGVMLMASNAGFRDWLHEWRHTDSIRGELRVVDGPLEMRSEAATVALGDGRVLIWGGRSLTADSGAIYDPRAGTWEQLPPAPGKGRFAAAAVWTGTEAVIWGGSVDSKRFELDPGGIAWNPTTRRWRTVPPAPVALMNARAAAFDKGILVAGGATLSNTNPRISLWLDNASGKWTRLRAPIDVVNTARRGRRLLATGPAASGTDSGRRAGWPVVAFDPDTVSWDPVASAVQAEWMAIAVAPDGGLSAVTAGFNEPLRAYKWADHQWAEVARTRRGAGYVALTEPTAYPPATAWADGRLLLGGMQGLTSWDPSSRRFATQGYAQLRTFGGTAVWTGTALVALSHQTGEGWVWTPR
jgi:hypothetical protein